MVIIRSILTVILLLSITVGNSQMIIKSPDLSDSYRDAELKYCTTNIDNGNGTTKAGVISAAVSFPSIYMASYAGTTIIAIQVGIAPNAGILSDCKVWLSHSLTGERLYEQAFHAVKGWNTVIFDEPYSVESGDLVIGYSCKVNSASNPFGISSNNPNIAHGGHFTMDGNWTTLFENNIDGNYCIVGVVEGETTNVIDLSIRDLRVPQYLKVGEQGFVKGTVFNEGNVSITSYKVSYSLNNNQYVDFNVDGIAINPGETHDFTIPYSFYVSRVGVAQIEVKISNINRLPQDYDLNNNMIKTQINVYNESDIVKRKVLLEHFTGERCPNCPAAEVALEGWVGDNEDIVWVHNFSGFVPDQYTITWDYCWFYNLTMTYAPAIMLDRNWLRPLNNQGPVFMPQPNYTPQLIKQRLNTPALVTVNIDGNFDTDTRQLDINISGTKIQDIAGDNPVLTVWLIEDNLPSTQPGVEKHHTVLRQIISQTFGDKVTYDGHKYRGQYSLVLDDKYNLDEVSIVAFVSNYDTINPNNCDVHNAEWIKLRDILGMPKNVIAKVVEPNAVITWDMPDQEELLNGYRVWRFLEEEESDPNKWTLLTRDLLKSTEYVDTAWDLLPSGMYKYAVKAVSTNGTTSPYSYSNFLKKTLSVDGKYAQRLRVYPNPVKDMLFINGEYSTAQIYDSLGRLLMTIENKHSVDVSDFPSGIYTLKVNHAGISDTYKIIR